MEKSKIAVFGGCGFLGQYLVDELIGRNYLVTVFDKTVSPLISKKVKHKSTDILDKFKVEQQILEGNFDIVYNLAGFANLDVANKFPYKTFELNVLGNINILDACVKAGVKRIVYASSAYAMSDKGSFYGISKLTSEKVIEEYSVRFSLDFTILRYGSVYSEKSFDNNYIYNLIESAINSGKIQHGGDGTEVREYIHAKDAAKLSVDVIESEQFINEHIIFTGIEKMRRVELFEMINEILGSNIKIELNTGEYHHHYKFTPYSYSPTLSKKLVSNPHIDMGQGIVECIKEIYTKKNQD